MAAGFRLRDLQTRGHGLDHFGGVHAVLCRRSPLLSWHGKRSVTKNYGERTMRRFSLTAQIVRHKT
jgi:hypothetical protein